MVLAFGDNVDWSLDMLPVHYYAGDVVAIELIDNILTRVVVLVAVRGDKTPFLRLKYWKFQHNILATIVA